MSREQAIEAAAEALRVTPGGLRDRAAAAIDAAAPYIASEVLREAANDWQTGGWSNDFPKKQSRIGLILGMAQRATDFLRARADRLEQP